MPTSALTRRAKYQYLQCTTPNIFYPSNSLPQTADRSDNVMKMIDKNTVVGVEVDNNCFDNNSQ